jgi:hypothetical protein
MYLVGIPGATSGEGRLQIESEDSPLIELLTHENGSFSQRMGSPSSPLLLTFTSANGDSESLSLELSPSSVDANSGTDTLRTLTEDSLMVHRDSSDQLRITGAPGTLPVGLAIIASNPETQDAASAGVNADGGFELTLQANPGDVIILFAVEPASSHGGGAPVKVTAP